MLFFGYQLSVISYRVSGRNREGRFFSVPFRLLVIGYQLSVICYLLSVIGFQAGIEWNGFFLFPNL